MKKTLSSVSLMRSAPLLAMWLMIATGAALSLAAAAPVTTQQPAVVPAPAPASPTLPPSPSPSPPAEKSEYDPTAPLKSPVEKSVSPPANEASAAEKDGPANDKKSFLWEVKSASNTVYLFGTIHVGKKSFYPLPDAVEKALASSKKIVVEADITKTDGLDNIGKLIMYEPPDTLQKKIPSQLFERLKVQLTRFKMPIESIKPMKPFMVGAVLSVNEFTRLGYDMNFGVDAYLIAAAQKQMKPVLELESQLGQIELLTNMPPLLQESFLENTLGSLETGSISEQIAGVVNAWQTGDTKRMQEVVAEGNKSAKQVSEFDEILLYSRHPGMLKKIETYLLEDQPHFVAVGSLHLLGPKGLVELLRAKGYKVKQL